MTQVTANIFRNFFFGSWSCKISKNGVFQRDIILHWPQAFENFSSMGTAEGLVVPPGQGVLDDTRQIAIAGWRSDLHRWCYTWFNEFGGSGELQWTSQEETDGVRILYGFVHECKQESDDPTEHIISCKILDQDNFTYTIRSFRKGFVEIVAERIRSGEELKAIMEKSSGKVTQFPDLIFS